MTTTKYRPLVTIESLADDIDAGSYMWNCTDRLRAMSLSPRHEFAIRNDLIERMLITRPMDWDYLENEIASYRSIVALSSDILKLKAQITTLVDIKMHGYLEDMHWAPEWVELRLQETFRELQALEHLGVIDHNYITAFTLQS